MITHELQVLRSRTTTSTSEYPYANSDVIIKEVYLNLNTEMKQSEIRFKIKDACSRKLPFLNENDFEFVNRVNGKIIIPTKPDDFNWDYSQVKKLAGQGKIYIKMKHSISPPDSDSSDCELASLYPSLSGQASSSGQTS